MPIIICPACQRKARVAETALGRTVKCPSCGAAFLAAIGDGAPPAQQVVEAEEGSELDPPSAAADEAHLVERAGIGILAISEALVALSLTLHLIVVLQALVLADSGARNSFSTSFSQSVGLLADLAGTVGVAAAVIGAAFCVMPATTVLIRSAAAAVLVLTALIAVRNPAGPVRELFAGAAPLIALAPRVLRAARQSMVAVYAAICARRLDDSLAAALATGLAIAYPLTAIGLTTLAIFVEMVSGKPHATFDRVLVVVDLLTQTVFVAWSAFVLWRVWSRLRPD